MLCKPPHSCLSKGWNYNNRRNSTTNRTRSNVTPDATGARDMVSLTARRPGPLIVGQVTDSRIVKIR